MPIYAYRCTSCGHAKDVLQRMSDPLLSACPECGAQAFEKQVTAAGFQLKGSGWYVTDFKGGAKPPAAGDGAPDTAKADAAGADGAKGDTPKPDAPKGDAAAAKDAKVPAASAESKTSAPAPAPPPKPAAPAVGGT